MTIQDCFTAFQPSPRQWRGFIVLSSGRPAKAGLLDVALSSPDMPEGLHPIIRFAATEVSALFFPHYKPFSIRVTTSFLPILD